MREEYAIIEDGKITKHGAFKELFPAVMSPKVLPDEYEGAVKISGAPDIPEGQYLEAADVAVVDGKPVYVYTYEDVPPMSQEDFDRRVRLALQEEADPLFFKWQAGECTQEEWQTKRVAVKVRLAEEYPNVETNEED